jgi:hypothetical protein
VKGGSPCTDSKALGSLPLGECSVANSMACVRTARLVSPSGWESSLTFQHINRRRRKPRTRRGVCGRVCVSVCGGGRGVTITKPIQLRTCNRRTCARWGRYR